MTSPRARCPICAQWPTLRKNGRLANHKYPWGHKRAGRKCPGSSTLPTNQLTMENP